MGVYCDVFNLFNYLVEIWVVGCNVGFQEVECFFLFLGEVGGDIIVVVEVEVNNCYVVCVMWFIFFVWW